jgi:L-threonylcarbamoyladenylate synthase
LQNTKKPLISGPAFPPGKAREVFQNGGVIAYPTETFYGLGVDPFNVEAVKRLFFLKGRPSKSPISLIIKDRPMLERLVQGVPPAAEKLIKRFWPGPLTIIFRAKAGLPAELLADTGKVGVRVSSNPVAQRLIEELDYPITATSANPSGKEPPRSSSEVIEYFNGSIDMLIDGGILTGRYGSTIVDITDNRIEIIREGEIPASKLG